MGKKPQRHSWSDAAKLCRLNQNDIEMAKRLGFGPDSLVRSRPDRKQRWKLPVREWIHELHFKRFRHLIGEKPVLVSPPAAIEYDPEAARRFEEEMYWDDYYDRNSESPPKRKIAARTASSNAPQPVPPGPTLEPASSVDRFGHPEITDEDVPF